MLTRGAARAGGMPLYKFAGNRILTFVENALAGLDLSEWHSGYRAYRVDALADIPFESYSDGFDFDTEIILGLHGAGKSIEEVPIPTYYGDEICYVNGVRYAKDVTADVVRYRLQRMGFGRAEVAAEPARPTSSSSRRTPRTPCCCSGSPSFGRVGCSTSGARTASSARIARNTGRHVTGVDMVKHEGVGERLDAFVEADLNKGLPPEVGTAYDCIVAADVLEHTIAPERCSPTSPIDSPLAGRSSSASPTSPIGTRVARVAAGRFDYDQRGLLDRGHVRFFTRRSFERLVDDCTTCRSRGAPSSARRSKMSSIAAGSRPASSAIRLPAAIDRFATKVWPTMFGYQFLYELRRRRA